MTRIGLCLPLVTVALFGAPALFAAACGARNALSVDDAEAQADAGQDVELDALPDAPIDSPPDALPDTGPVCLADGDPCDVPSVCCSGACTAGTCALGITNCTLGAPPEVLFTGTPAETYGIAVDDTHVYWSATTGEILKVPKAGGAPVVLAQSASPRGVALDGTHLYWAADDGVQRVPKAGGPAELISPPTGIPWFLTVDAVNVYWTDHFGGTVRRAPKDTSGTTDVIGKGTTTFGIASAGSQVFFGDNDEAVIFAVPKLGGAPVAITAMAPTPWAIAVDDRVYWTQACGPTCGTVNAVSKSGGPFTTLASGFNQPLGIAVDATHVYFADWASNAIRKVDKGGANTMTLASGAMLTAMVAVDASCVYWVDIDGTLSKVHK